MKFFETIYESKQYVRQMRIKNNMRIVNWYRLTGNELTQTRMICD